MKTGFQYAPPGCKSCSYLASFFGLWFMFKRANSGAHPVQRLFLEDSSSGVVSHASSHWLVGLCILVNMLICIPLAAKLNIWIDEAYTLDTTSRGVQYAIQQAIGFEEQAPFYFLLLSLWRTINGSIFFARLFSIASISLTIYLVSLISKKLFQDLHPGWLTATVALNPFIIWAAIEIRLYAFSILLSACLILLFLEAYWGETPQRKARWLYILVATVSIYTHYFLGFLIIAQGATLLVSGRWRAVKAFLLDMVVVSILFVPMVMALVNQILSVKDNVKDSGASLVGKAGNPLIEGIKNSFLANLRYLLPDRIDTLSSSLYRFIRFAILFGLLFIGFRYRRFINPNTNVVWIMTLALSVVYLIAFTFLPMLFHPRHNMVLFLPAVLSMFAALSLIPGRTRFQVLCLFSVLLFGIYGITLVNSYTPLAKTGDYARVASFINRHEAPGQPILVFNPEVEMTFRHYYQGSNQLVALPKPESFEEFNWQDLVIKKEEDLIVALSKLPRREVVWLLMDDKWLKNSPIYRESYEIIEGFVKAHYQTEISQDFYGSNLRLLRQKASSSVK